MAKEDAAKKGNGHHYDASDISVLEGLEPVRRLPACTSAPRVRKGFII